MTKHAVPYKHEKPSKIPIKQVFLHFFLDKIYSHLDMTIVYSKESLQTPFIFILLYCA